MAEFSQSGLSKAPAEAASQNGLSHNDVANETGRAADSVPVGDGVFKSLPTQFGRYEIQRQLGQGMMGAVYLARDTQLDRRVALKVPRVSDSNSQELLKRLKREAQVVAKLEHPNIGRIYDQGELDGIHFIAMEFIDGESLKSMFLQTGRMLKPVEAVQLIRRLLQIVAVAHEHGIVHRDLKPENIMLRKKDGDPVILDFGLAKFLVPTAPDASQTDDGAVLGSAAYMSPEQAQGNIDQVDGRSDIYALGVMLFEMLTGRWPFVGRGVQVMSQKAFLAAPSPLDFNQAIPPELASVCQKMIAKRREDRFRNCQEVIAALDLVDTNACAFDEIETQLLETPRGPNSEKVDTKRTLQSRLASSFGGRNSALRWALMSGSAALVAVIAIVLLPTRYGVLQIEIEDPTLSVRFDGQSVTIDNDGQPMKITPNVNHHLEILQNGVTIESASRELVVARGKTRQLKISLVDGQVAIDGTIVSPKSGHAATSPGSLDTPPQTAKVLPATVPAMKNEQGGDATKPPLAFETPEFERWISSVASMPAHDQIDAVVKKLRELNPRFDGTCESKIEDAGIAGFSFLTDNVTDISPVRALTGLRQLSIEGHYPVRSEFSSLSPLKGMKLESLSCGNSNVSDLTPLDGMPLKHLSCVNTQISELSPLKGMPLEELRCEGCAKLADLSPLQGAPLTRLSFYATNVASLLPLREMRLTSLDCGGTPVADLSPLQGMPLTELGCWKTHVFDLSPLRGMKLRSLRFNESPVTSLSPLSGMPLAELNCWDTGVTDLTPLKDMSLTVLVLAPKNIDRGLEIIRSMKTLEAIGVAYDSFPCEAFWRKYDAGEFGKAIQSP